MCVLHRSLVASVPMPPAAQVARLATTRASRPDKRASVVVGDARSVSRRLASRAPAVFGQASPDAVSGGIQSVDNLARLAEQNRAAHRCRDGEWSPARRDANHPTESSSSSSPPAEATSRNCGCENPSFPSKHSPESICTLRRVYVCPTRRVFAMLNACANAQRSAQPVRRRAGGAGGRRRRRQRSPPTAQSRANSSWSRAALSLLAVRRRRTYLL